MRSAVALARRALDADLHVTATRDRDELRAFLDERLGAYGTVVIVGGDGSLGVAYNAVADRPDVTLGYIPAGFGNATAHLLKLPRHPAALAGVLLAADARPIDLVSVNGRLALFAGAGWDAEVARRYAAGGAQRLRGWATAVTASLPDLGRRHRVRVVADGETIHEGPMILTVASTTPFYGRGLLVNPGARPDAGQLTARVYPGPAPRWRPRRAAGHRAASPSRRGVAASTLDDLQPDLAADPGAGRWRPHRRGGGVAFEVRPAAVRLIGKW